MVYIMFDGKMPDYRLCSENSVRKHEKDIVVCVMHGKRRAELLAECVERCINLGLTEAYVKNICNDSYFSKKNGEPCRYESQSWYVFLDDGKWYYKQSKNTKARHEIVSEAVL